MLRADPFDNDDHDDDDGNRDNMDVCAADDDTDNDDASTHANTPTASEGREAGCSTSPDANITIIASSVSSYLWLLTFLRGLALPLGGGAAVCRRGPLL